MARRAPKKPASRTAGRKPARTPAVTAEVVTGDARLTEDELLRRRQQVLWLKHTRRLTSADIGQRLNVSLRTIERDLAWWRTEFRTRYSYSAPTFDVLGDVPPTATWLAPGAGR